MKNPAAGGGRWVEVPPERLVTWVVTFAERHGGAAPDRPVTTGDSGVPVTFTAADGATAECHPPFPPLILLALLAALLIPGTGWLLAAFVNVILLFWLMTFVADAFAFGRSQRRWHHHGGWQRPRYPSGRHYTWL